MKIKLSKSKWEDMGKKAGWLAEPRECNCGSGQIQEPAFDARGIFLTNVCPKCKKAKLSKYRQDVLNNPSYEAYEPIEPEAKSIKRIKMAQFEEKMMPGQTPYTEDENKLRNKMINDSSRAEEEIGIEALDNDEAPSLKSKMMNFLRKKYSGLSEDIDDSAEIAIYWFANHYHGGQWSELYSILSTSPYRPGPMGKLENEGEEVQMMYEDLESVKEFKK